MRFSAHLLFLISFPLVTSLHIHASHDLVNIQKINPTIRLDILYATTKNFTHKKVYPSAHCFLRRSVAKKLDLVQKELKKKGLGLKIFDGYRPLSVQKKFWSICPDPRYVLNPNKPGGSRHNRGIAVDVTLINLKTGKELEMPSAYDDFSSKAHRDYHAIEKRNPIAAKNCKLLETVMHKHGFTGIKTEWWHFDFKSLETSPALDVSFEKLSQK